jgi:predicted Zn-dependent protease
MHKKKDELRDIYQSPNHDLEKDFTPQVARERVEERQRELRRSRVVSFFLGGLVLLFSIALVSVAIRDYLSERKVSRRIRAKEAAYIPRHSLPSDALWVMEYQAVAAQADASEKPGPKPLSTKWVKNAAYHIIMGQQALALNETDTALEHFGKVVAIYPDIEGLHSVLGQLYLKREEYTVAAQHLEKALREDEKSFEVLSNLGAAWIGAKQYEAAESCLKRALAEQPENPGCHKNLAALYREMERADEAVYHFEKYIDLQPSDLNTMQSYALYLTKIGRWKEAADFLTELTQEVTDVAPIYFLLAQVQMQNGQQEKAIAALQRGIQLMDPQMALAWMSRDEFNSIRNSGEFKTLVNQLEVSRDARPLAK